jgi:hypothetical protein
MGWNFLKGIHFKIGICYSRDFFDDVMKIGAIIMVKYILLECIDMSTTFKSFHCIQTNIRALR